MSEQMRSAELLVQNALKNESTIELLKANPEQTLKTLLAEVQLQTTRALPNPTPPTTNAIWLTIVISCALVMLFSAYAIVAGMNVELKTGVTYMIKGENALTLFSTTIAFLAGLLAPSPVKKNP